MNFKRMISDIDAYIDRDPAARSRWMVILSYPGFHATMFHHGSHWLWRHRWHHLARWISNLGRWLTGIEIHPGAQIGERLVIDHGMGVVIGETAEIGDGVTLYHGVTLGGIAPSIDSESQKSRKRHPTVGDGAIIGSGAQVLGPTLVGACARVGANAVVVRDVLPGATVVGIPARQIAEPRDVSKDEPFAAYGTPRDLPDPIARTLKSLERELGEIKELRARLERLEAKLGSEAEKRRAG
jgi:serine O-acetyltransferase